jgi:hypothetical protein
LDRSDAAVGMLIPSWYTHLTVGHSAFSTLDPLHGSTYVVAGPFLVVLWPGIDASASGRFGIECSQIVVRMSGPVSYIDCRYSTDDGFHILQGAGGATNGAAKCVSAPTTTVA